MDNPTRKELEDLARQIRQDQIKASPAEKRVKIKTSFKNAVKKMGQTPSPKKKTD
jgi:hypothetical protein